jgi:putative endonuclease
MPFERSYYVYILTNWNNRVMCVGITNNLERLVYEHKQKLVKGFRENTTSANWSILRRPVM